MKNTLVFPGCRIWSRNDVIWDHILQMLFDRNIASISHALLAVLLLASCRATSVPQQDPTDKPATETQREGEAIQEQLNVVEFAIGEGPGEVATSVIELDNGDFLIAGYEYQHRGGDWDSLVLLVSPEGELLWRSASDEDGDDYAWVVREATEDTYVVVGTRLSAGGDADGYMNAIDSDGNVIWRKTYGGPGSEIFWTAERASDEGFFLVGQTDSEGSGGLDFYVVRTDQGGQMLWSKTYGTPETDRAFGVAPTPDGGALLVGFQGSDPNMMDMLFVRIAENGRELWRQSLAGSRFDVAHDVALVPGGGFIISGYTSSWGPGDQDGVLIRLAEDGHLLWMKSYGDPFDDRILHVALMEDGGFAMIGYSAPRGTEGWDLVTRRTDEEGNLLWSYRAGGSHPDQGKDIALARDGAIVVVGGTQSEHPPNDDVILIKFYE